MPESRDLSLLLDTNVWLDLFIPSNTGHDAAWNLVRAAAAYKGPHGTLAQLLYPARIVADVFYMVRLEAKRWIATSSLGDPETRALACRNHAWDCIHDMDALGTAVGMDGSDVWTAIRYRSIHEDLEDDFILAAADRAHPDYLVTSDRKLARKARVATATPVDLSRMLTAHMA